MSSHEFVTYVFTWHALTDACSKCRYLDGKEYRDQDVFQSVLWDHFWGDIWNLNAGYSLAHPHCRCQVEVRVEIDWPKFRALSEFEQALYMSTGYTAGDIAQLRKDLDDLNQKIDELTPKLERAPEQLSNFRELEGLALRYLAITHKLGLPENAQQVINTLSRLIVLMRMTQRSIHALEIAAGPIGWLYALASVATTAFAVGDVLMEVQSH